MEVLLQDVNYGLRMLRKKPTFTIVAVLTLALGVGATTAIFSIVNAVLLRSLPFHDPNRLVRINFNEPGIGLKDVPFSEPELEDLSNRAGVFEDVSAVLVGSVNLTGGKQPERLELLVSNPNYFSMLGVRPQLGRIFGPQDFALGFSSSVMISDSLWHREFGADPNVIGRNLQLDSDPYTIVGVLPPDFRHPGSTVARDVEIFSTAGFAADPGPKPARSARFLPVAIGRIKPGITFEQAQVRLSNMALQLRHDFATDYAPEAQWTIEIEPLQEALVGKVRAMLLVLLGAVMLIVMIVALNTANLLLARASGRQQEMAVRLALGASRKRVMQQMLTESMLIAAIGGIAGILTAVSARQSILHLIPASIPRLHEVRIDWVVLAFALLVSLATGLIFGMAPAIQSSRAGLSSAIREGARGSGWSTKTGRLRDVLIVSELAFAVVLMVGAGLLLRTLGSLLNENPGFNPSHVVTANIWLPEPNNPKLDPYLNLAQRAGFDRELLRRMNSIPGVEQAAITSALPGMAQNDVGGGAVLVQPLNVEGRAPESSQDLMAEGIRVSPDYFRVMQIPVVRGRLFSDDDVDGKMRVAVIDEATARHYWGDRDPVGQRVRFGSMTATITDPSGAAANPWWTVVGIVKYVKNDGLDIDGVPHVYLSTFQNSVRTLSVVLRTSLAAPALEPEIRRQIQSIDPGLPVFNVSSMENVLDRSLAPRRFSADLVGAFAGLALVLASIGIYGLLAYMVGQRAREIGVRIALGAGRADILKLVLSRGFVLAGTGVLAGIVFASLGASMMSSVLYGVRPHDPLVFAGVAVILQLVALLASTVPALRAAKVDPMKALREA